MRAPELSISYIGFNVNVPPFDDPNVRLAFAKAIDDFQWIHVDPARARDSPFGGTIAHGFLTLSLLSRMAADAMLRPEKPRTR